MKKLKKSMAFLTALILILSIFPATAFAADTSDGISDASNVDSIHLRTAVIDTEKTDDGYEITFSLLQEAQTNSTDDTYSTQAIGWIIVGYGKENAIYIQGMVMELLTGLLP